MEFLLSLCFLLLILSSGAIIVTRDEANIAGVQYSEPFIIAEFLISTTYRKAMCLCSQDPEQTCAEQTPVENTHLTSQHLHTLTEEFCDGRTRQCTSREYYLVLDKIISLDSELYEHRLRDLTEVILDFNKTDYNNNNNNNCAPDDENLIPATTYDVSRESSTSLENLNNNSVDGSDGDSDGDGGTLSPTCGLQVLHRAPLPEEFYNFVKNSQPFIIRSPLQPKRGEATAATSSHIKSNIQNKYTDANSASREDIKVKEDKEREDREDRGEEDQMWSLRNLHSMFGNSTVIVNASPTSDFDGVSE